jgi:hypothetical protein
MGKKKKHLEGLPIDHPDVVADRLRTIRKYGRDLTSWLSTSIVLIAINIFLSGNISWAKYPVFFWGIVVVAEYINIFRLKREQREYEARQVQQGLPRAQQDMMPPPPVHQESVPDYSDTLLEQEAREREHADLTEVRKLKRPWRDEDLV